MTIYEIDAAILSLVDENGEITDIEALDSLQMERDQKIENTILFIKDMTAEAAAIREEEINLAERRHKLENNVDRLKGYLDYALSGQKFETPKCSVSWRRIKVADINEEQCMSYLVKNNRDDCLIFSEPRISRKAVLDALKAGEVIEGAEMKEKVSPIIK